MTNRNQKGFAALEIIIVVVVVGILGFAGWLVYDRQKSNNDTTDTVQTTESTDQEVKSAEDLKKVEDQLNQSDIDKELDTTEIDAALSEQ